MKGGFIALSVVISLLNVAGQALDASAFLALLYASASDAALLIFCVLGGAAFFYAVFRLPSLPLPRRVGRDPGPP